VSLNFPKSKKILKSCDFIAVYRKGKRLQGDYFYIAFVSGSRKTLGITVSSKIGPAVQRNRIKRVIRELFRLNKGKFPEGKVVLTAKQDADRLTNGEIREDIFRLLNKIK